MDRLEALEAVLREGTMARAAVRLRITTSAVSKRLAALERELGRPVLRRDGRRVLLTPEGRRILEATSPLVARLRETMAGSRAAGGGSLEVGVSESILASWGAALLRRAADRVPGLRLTLHAHRGPGSVARVAAGDYALAMVAGSPPAGSGLRAVPLGEEEMVLVPSGLDAAALEGLRRVPVLGIEAAALTARALGPRLARLRRAGGPDLRVERTVESYAALVSLAREGFGHGLAPLGIVRAMGVPPAAVVRLPSPGLRRPVVLLGRSSLLRAPPGSALRAALLREAAGSLPGPAGERGFLPSPAAPD